jgi:DNA-binding response OmpR family regulator
MASCLQVCLFDPEGVLTADFAASLHCAGFEPVPTLTTAQLLLMTATTQIQPLQDYSRRCRSAGYRYLIAAFLSPQSNSNRIALLDAGVDILLPWPMPVDELVAQLRALQRRLADLTTTVAVVSAPLHWRDLSVDPTSREVRRAGQLLRLTVKEFDLLTYLLEHHGVVLERQQILKAVWGETWVGDDNLLDVYIRYLRKKIERPDLEPLIHTVRGVGFVLK